MVSNMLSPGVALQPLIKSGTLVVRSYLPEAMGVEEHLFHALKDLDEFQPQHVVVDAISACKRMGSDQAAFEYLMRILNACKERGMHLYLYQPDCGFGHRRRNQWNRHFVRYRYHRPSAPSSDRWRHSAPADRHEVKRVEAF